MMRSRKWLILVILSIGSLLSIQQPTSAQVGTNEVVSLTLDPSMIVAGSYNAPFGSGNGVYITAPNITPPPNDVPY